MLNERRDIARAIGNKTGVGLKMPTLEGYLWNFHTIKNKYF
jgi:hypothetical protein